MFNKYYAACQHAHLNSRNFSLRTDSFKTGPSPSVTKEGLVDLLP